MQARGVWFGNEQWPTGSSPGAFAKDVFRIEGCRTDREKALAFNSWFLRCMQRGPELLTPGLGGMLRSFDTHQIFSSWGHHVCTGWGWVATEALQAAGLKTRRAVVNRSGHTFQEVWYAGKDGKEGWHAFDPFLGWHFLNDSGEVASCDELAANPDLVANPRAGGRHRLGHHPERSKGYYYGYHVGDLLDVEQPTRGDELRYDLMPGQVMSHLWRPEHVDLAWSLPKYPHGAHCDITMYDEEGRPRYPEHAPYWKHYMWPTDGQSNHINGTEPVRWHGCGALRWRPLEYGKAAASRSHNVIFEDGSVRPTGTRKHAEVWWHIKVPYLTTHLAINSAVEAGGSDLVGFSISPDDGRSMHKLHWGKGPPPTIMTFSPPAPDAPQEANVHGLREFWLRLDMSTQIPNSPLRVRGFKISLGYQLNMQVLPRLVPGDNHLYLQADELNGVNVSADWAFTHPRGEKLESLKLTKSGRATHRYNPQIENPDDLIMRGVTLRCEANGERKSDSTPRVAG